MRGKLTIFVGYAAGVGKTYAMLRQAQIDAENGIDVVVGYVEPHDRKETSDQLKNLEVLAYKEVNYSNIKLREFDLSLALARKPELILVDELAHTNPSSFTNSKRYQDINDLLDEGINVYTTVNIQHIESLNSIIYEHTNVDVKETIPDSVFDNADYIKVIDIEVEDLIERLTLGKVYNKAKIENALTNFFKKDKLVVLRELTLRKSADKVSNNSVNTVKEVVLVCLSTAPSNPKVLRSAKNIADAFHGELYSIYVDVGQDDQKEILEKHKQIASNLGAKNKTVYGDNIYDEIVTYAKQIKATKIVIGKSVKSNVKSYIVKDIVDELNYRLPKTDIYVIPNEVKEKKKGNKNINVNWISVLIGFIVYLLTTIISFGLYELHLNDSLIILVYVLSIIAFSMFNSKFIYTIVYSLISILTFNYLFTEPRFTFQIYAKGYPLMLGLVFVISILINYINYRLKENYKKTKLANNRLKILFEASNKINGQSNYNDVIKEFIDIVKNTLNCEVSFYNYNKSLTLYDYSNELDFNSSHEVAIASVCYEKKIQTGKYTANISNSKYTYFPVLDGFVNIKGVVGIYHNDNKIFSNFENALFISYIQLLAHQITLYENNQKIKQNQVEIENEKFKLTLLRSVSHDLKTPLTGINGNSQLLLNDNLDEKSRQKVLDIYKESVWLKNMVDNILSITRIQESKKLNLEVNEISDIISEALNHCSSKLKERHVKVNKTDEVLLINCESYLLVQAFVNLLNNAVEHTNSLNLIEINVSKAENEVIVEVNNDGEQINVDEKERIFELFYSTKTDDSKRGSGLGLFITKSIIEMHNGSISLDVSRITKFIIKLPLYKGVEDV